MNLETTYAARKRIFRFDLFEIWSTNLLNDYIQCLVSGCGKMVSTKMALHYHLKNYHESPIGMENSVESLSTAEASSAPSSQVSNDGFQFKCNYNGCSKSYKAKAYLVQHVRKHTGEKPFR